MRSRPTFWILFGLLVMAGIWCFWPASMRPPAARVTGVGAPTYSTSRSAAMAPQLFTGKPVAKTAALTATNPFPWRLSNTPLTLAQLMKSRHGILLENALIDSSRPLNLAIPKGLQAQGDPGAYIVQARGPIGPAFRATLAAAGAQMVSYIPNNAYLVTVPKGGAAMLAGEPGVQAVLPYEPYYKLPASLLPWVGKTFPADRTLRVAAYPNNADAVATWLAGTGAQIVGRDTSPFGETFVVQNVTDLTRLAQQAGLQRIEPAFRRALANDLARVTMGISVDTVTNANYMNLSGSNVVVEVNDTGIDATHPDFSATGSAETGPSGPTRVFGSALTDTNGHGTHVAGIIAGDGSESYTLNTNEPQGSVTNADFRGKAPAAKLYSYSALDNNGALDISDYELQSAPALTNALISNNSWTYVGDNSYNLSAASYDAAVRDALPYVTGSQPVLFVFAAGNDGGGDDNGAEGEPDTILSPGTAKDVITVGALEQSRNITNTYTPLNTTNPVAAWAAGTDSSTDVAGYSARGNVGIGSEGTYGRFKPDVVAPGSFVVSTRSQQWDMNAYYNPTNYYYNEYADQVVGAGSLHDYSMPVPGNAVSVKITLTPTGKQPFPTNMLIYVRQADYPTTTLYDFVTSNNMVSIPPDGGANYLNTVLTNGFKYAVGNSTNVAVSYNVETEVTTTNDLGNYYQVLSNLNNTLAPYYRYESGTSMAAPAVAGALALIQDYFTNTLHAAPSPAVLKALLVNGARPVGNYNFVVTNGINFQGWGQANVPTSVPYGLTNVPGAEGSSFFLDQSPTNALATGMSQSWLVTVDTNSGADQQPLRVTLAWTDPPGNPSAAIKLVNNLDLMVSNNVTGDVFFGNDFPYGAIYTEAWDTNGPPTVDAVNNVENVYLETAEGGSYTVTVLGTSVNVNAVTAQSNNVVQDFALVISSGDGGITNAITVSPPPAPNTLLGPLVTLVSSTNTLLMNQLAGANTPLLGTNTIGAGAGYATNALITLGMTNQWHFYVVTNTLGYTNAAFISVLSQTLATPRMGVFADVNQNPTQPEADIDLYVAGPNDPNASALTNLDPNVISNCVNGVNGDAVSLGNGVGTEFVAYSNAQPGQVYYIGIKSETQEAAEYDFLPVFSELPFSQTDSNGVETVNGLLLPVAIPDGSPAHPGVAYVFALAVQPIEVQDVIVSNQLTHQNLGDLVGLLTHGGKSVVLNNHDSLYNDPDIYDLLYDQSPAPLAGSQPADGPGSLRNFQGQQGVGPWVLTEVDSALTQTGAVTGFTLYIKPHINLGNQGVNVSIAPQSWFYGYVDVPPGTTNLTIAATNTLSVVTFPPLQMFEKLGDYPTLTNYDKSVFLTNGTPPGGAISIGPSDVPPLQPGRYYVGIYNGSTTPYTSVFVIARVQLGQVATVDFSATGPTNLLDDAVMDSTINVTNTQPIAAIGVGLRVDHPRISDLVFHLISPDGTRYLLMENRGGLSTNGAGITLLTTNSIANVNQSGTTNAVTNFIAVSQSSGTLPISWNFFNIPDQMTVYDTTNNFTTNNLIFDTGMVSGSGQTNLAFTTTSGYLTIIMNQFGNTNGANGDQWTYTAGGVVTNFYYLVLTENTNQTTTPIKFAPTPFVYAVAASSAGWTQWAGNGHFYKAVVQAQGLTWDQADQIAHNQSAYLATITSAAENNFVFSLINSSAFFGNWFGLGSGPAIGGIQTNGAAEPAGGWTWETGEPWTYSNWLSGQPDNNPGLGKNENRVYYWSSASGVPANTWNDFPNNQILSPGSYVMERDSITQSNSDQYYQPEQDLSPLIGTSAYGTWTLEIQDDRVGATNQTVLDSWQIQLVFANTNPVPAVIGTGGVTNFIPAGGLAWYEVDVPFNADYATNTLTFATGPLNMWFSTNVPPTVTNPAPVGGDVMLLTGSTGGSVILGTNGSPANVNPPAYLVPGGTYYIGIQNPGVVTYQYGFQVNFHLTQLALELPGQTNQFDNELVPLVVTNTAIVNTNGTLAYAVTMSIDTNAMNLLGWTNSFANVTNTVPVIDTNGVITWTPSEAQGPGVYDLTTVVTDAAVGLSATNTFAVTVYEVNVAPYFLATPTNQYVTAFAQLVVTNAAADSDLPTNLLNYALVGAPAGMSIDTNGVITWTPTAAQAPATNLITTVVTDTNPPAVNAKSLSATNTFTVYVSSVAAPFAFTQPAQAVTGIGAQLNGMATPNGLPSTAWFQWGTNTLYGSNTPPVSVGAGFNVVYTTNALTGLALNVPYHFRLVVSNALTMVYGFDQILDEANVAAWGADYVGQAAVPAGLSNVVAIAGAYDHSLALKNDGTAVGWGDNTFGQASVSASLTNLLAIAGGEYYSMVLKSGGTVAAWGANILGQTNLPAGLSNVVTIAGGQYASLALKNNGVVAAWGASFFGLTNVPAGVSNVVAIAGGSYHNLALKNDGTVAVWGDDSANQTNVPPGLTNVVAIAGGSYHSLALKNDGSVVAWGDNSSGQTNVPPGLTNVVAVAAGGFHNLALRNDGSVVAWGDNSSGQKNVPAGVTNFVAIAAGYFHSLGLTPQLVSSLTNVLNLTNGVPQTNNILPNSVTYYQVNVPTNADFATNQLLFTQNGPLNLWFTTNTPPTLAGAYGLLAGVTNGTSALSTTSAPTNIVPGAAYYLGVQNTNNVAVDYGIEVDFHLTTSTNTPGTNVITIASILRTNGGFLLTWFAPSNDLFQVQCTTNLAPADWLTFTNPAVVSYNTNFPASATNAQFNFFDDGSQIPFGATRFYRLVLLPGAANTLSFPSPTNRVASINTLVSVTNVATDSNPAAVLTYALLGAPAGAAINVTNGVITWTNATPAGLAARFTTSVFDNGTPAAYATNLFTVFVAPLPAITNTTVTATNVVLHWSAPTNDVFQVRWATNLAPPIAWTTFVGTISSPVTGSFSFTDTNAPVLIRFYQLILLP